ncbi:hypothetical protein Tco_1218666 [Tanacetum coccineum]
MGRDTVQLETAVSTISQEYLLEFTSEYGISEGLHPELPGRGDRIVDFPEGKVGVYTKFFEFANFRIPISQFLFDILGHYQIHLSQLSVIGAAKVNHFEIQCRVLNIIPSVNLFQMDLFNLISAPNPAIVKTGTRQRTAHEVPLLTATASRVIDMEDVVATSTSSGTPAAIDKSPLDFSNEDPPPMITNQDETESQIPAETSREAPPVQDTTTTEVAPEVNLEREVTAMGPLVNKRRRKRDQSETEANAPPKVLRTDHASVRPESHTRGGKSLAVMGLGAGSTVSTPIPQETPADVIGPGPLSYARPQSIPERDIAQSSKGTAAAEDPESKKSTSFTSLAGSPGGIYQPGWGVTNDCRLDTPEACQDTVDHSVPPGYFSELRHLPNPEFLSQYNMTLARQVAMGSQLRLRFEQEVRLRREATAKIARRDQRIQAREEEIKKLDEEVKSLRVVETEYKIDRLLRGEGEQLSYNVDTYSNAAKEFILNVIRKSECVNPIMPQEQGRK